MAEQALFNVTDFSLLTSLAKYGAKEELRGKSLMDTAKKVFRFLVSFALAKIPNGDPKKIRDHLLKITTASRRLSAWAGASSSLRTRKVRRAEDALRGTLAAKLVWMMNYLGAQHVKGPAFYRLVRKFVNSRAYSARLHRAGLYPALQGTNQTAKGGKLPKYKHVPGSYNQVLTESIVTILAENWASAHGPNAKGIIGLASFAFDQALPEVDALLMKYLQQDIEKAARSAGFIVPRVS